MTLLIQIQKVLNLGFNEAGDSESESVDAQLAMSEHEVRQGNPRGEPISPRFDSSRRP